ncbi:MAG: extracellular solute-binding protein [Chloroflexi bacterium]|nr:extracellular solute-binding protein [Chloroflexota bacterium]
MKKLAFSAVTLLSLILVAYLSVACTLAIAPTPAPAMEAAAPVVKTGWAAKWEAVLAGAKKEGEVLVYANVVPATREMVRQAFQEKFGIMLDMLVMIGPEGGTRLNAEYRAGIHRPDILIAGTSIAITTVKPEKNLQPMEPLIILPDVRDPGAWLGGSLPFEDKDAMTIGFIAAYQPAMVRNTELVRDGAITSYKDLLKPEWKGKVIIFDPSITGSGAAGFQSLVVEWGYDAALDYLRALVRQEPVITRDYRVQVESVSRGKYPVTLWARPETINEFIPLGATIAPVKLTEPGLVVSGASGVAVPKNPAHPNGAIVFLNWLLSKEGQTLYSRSVNNPSARQDVPVPDSIPPIMRIPPGEKPFRGNEELILERPKLMREAGTILSALMK